LKLWERISKLTMSLTVLKMENSGHVEKGKDRAVVIDVDAGAGDDGDDEDCEDEELPARPPPVIQRGEASSSHVSQGD
jgi:hypothetical protein